MVGDRILERLAVGEVAVDRALADAGLGGDGPHRRLDAAHHQGQGRLEQVVAHPRRVTVGHRGGCGGASG
ncbi:MAG: hypothetical protein R2726_20395 [Acidimicrobiales bacterium]